MSCVLDVKMFLSICILFTATNAFQLVPVRSSRWGVIAGASDDPFSRLGRIAKDKLGETSIDPSLPGAVLGGLVAGPFGALIGLGVGSSLGDRQKAEKALEGMNLDKEVVEEGKRLAETLQLAKSAEQAAATAAETAQQRCTALKQQEATLYGDAKAALSTGDEAAARGLLATREAVKASLEKALTENQSAAQRAATAQDQVFYLETQAREMNAVFERAARVGQRPPLE